VLTSWVIGCGVGSSSTGREVARCSEYSICLFFFGNAILAEYARLRIKKKSARLAVRLNLLGRILRPPQ